MVEPNVQVALDNLKEYLLDRLDCHKELTDQRDETKSATLTATLENINRQLAAIPELRQQITELSGRIVTRQEVNAQVAVIAERVEANRVSQESRLEQTTNPLRERIEEIGRPKWTNIASFISIIAGLIAGAWVVTGLKVDAAVNPVSQMVIQVKAADDQYGDRITGLEKATSGSAQADVQSRTDRLQLNERVRHVEESIAEGTSQRKAHEASNEAKMTEIETQFCASDIFRNMLDANTMRMLSMLWTKTYPGEKLPTDNAYYPQICNRNGSAVAPGR